MLYRFIYNANVNFLIRNLLFIFRWILPEKLKIHPSGTIKLKVKNERPFYLKTNQTSYISRNLFWNGADQYEYTSIFKKLIKEANVFFDIGASIGYYSILAGHLNPKLRIYAFEPTEGALFYLNENIKINNLQHRTKIESFALSNTIGETEFNVIVNKKYPTIYNLSGEHNLKTKNELNANTVMVKTDTLDHYISENKIAEISIMKLDTEATEHYILQGATTLLEKLRPIIICEVLFNKIENELEAIMKDKDYRFFGEKHGKLIPLSTLIRTTDNGIRNCFFIPKEKEETIADFLTN